MQRTKQLIAVFREDHEAMLLAAAGRLVPRDMRASSFLSHRLLFSG